MTTKNDPNDSTGGISRRDFLTLAAATGLLAGCSNPTQQPDATPVPAVTEEPIPEPTDEPTTEPTVEAAAEPVAATGRSEIIKFHPDAPSKVVHTHHSGVWDGETLSPDAIRQMLDASITELTGLDDVASAWAALFDPGERVAIKVNAFRNSLIWTHVPLVMAVTERLQEAGVPAEQIVIFDYYTSELETAGYPVNPDGPGVRCYGDDGNYTGGQEVAGRDIQLSDILLGCDALINIPVLKSHMIAGVSFAMKNHYGSFSNPASLHRNIGQRMAELNALPPIKERTRLIIGDMLSACINYRNSYPYWDSDWTGDSILMSFDPVAHDTVGLETLIQLKTGDGGNPTSITNMATPCMESGAEWGLGTNDPDNIDLVEVHLG